MGRDFSQHSAENKVLCKLGIFRFEIQDFNTREKCRSCGTQSIFEKKIEQNLLLLLLKFEMGANKGSHLYIFKF